MIKIKKMKEKQLIRYIFKWLVMIFLIFTLVSIFFNVFIYYMEERHYTEIVKNGQVERINYIAKSIEEEIGKIKVSTYYILRENTVLDLYSQFNFVNSHNKYILIEAVSKRCMEITNMNSFIKNCFFYLKKADLKISLNNYDYIDENEMLEFINHAKSSSTITMINNRLFIVDTLNINYLGNKWEFDNIGGIIVAEIDVNSLKKELKYAKLTDDDIVLLTDQNNENIYASTSNLDPSILKGINNEFIKLNGEKYKVLSSSSTNNQFKIYYLEKQDIISMLYTRTILNILLFSGIVIFTIIICVNLFYSHILRPLNTLLVDAFRQIKMSNLEYRIPIPKNEVFREIYQNFNFMVERIDSLVSKELKQEILVKEANFKHLQAQINPHFMYNSYFILYRLIKMNDRESSIQVCENLGKFFQYITRDSKDDKSLIDEIKHAESYTVIQGYRFRGQVKINFNKLPECYNYIIVPRLIIQPIIENVFKYVVDEIADEEVILNVHYFETDHHLIICIENSGHISDEELMQIQDKLNNSGEKEDITALININYRLNIYFNQEKSIEVFKSSLGGLEVHIKVRM